MLELDRNGNKFILSAGRISIIRYIFEPLFRFRGTYTVEKILRDPQGEIIGNSLISIQGE